MCASHYNSRTGSCASLANVSSHLDGSTVVQVKITNLNKGTTRGHIKSRLRQFNIIDVKLIKWRKQKVNHAFVHLPDYDTAQQVVRAVHNQMEMHSNLLKAVLKEGRYEVRPGRSISVQSLPQPEQSLPQSEQSLPQSEQSLPQSEQSLPQSEQSLPQSERSLPQSERSLPQSEWSLPQSEQSLPQSEWSLPQSEQASIDTNVVGLLVYDKETSVTESELKLHFTRYGDVDSMTTEYKSHPQSYNIRFTSAISAHAARYDSPHNIRKASVIALPLPREGKVEKDVTTKEFSCNPLVVTDAARNLLQELQEESRIKIFTRKRMIVVHIQRDIDDLKEQKILRIIRICESEISQTEMELDFHFLPVLAEQETQKLISAFRETYDIKICRGRETVLLDQLSQDYSDRLCDSEGAAAFKQYLGPSTSASDKVRHQWYWQDDNEVYQPYSEEVNKYIERFKDKSYCLLEIGRFSYIINCTAMTQTNVSTGRSRPLRRKQIHPEESLVLTLKLWAHKNHLQHLRRAISNAIAGFSMETKIEVPNTALQASSFQEVIEKLKKNPIKVTIDRDKNGIVCIQGKPILVRTAEAQLHKVILKIVAEKSFHVTMPNTWELQTKKCELKSVTRGSPEWTDIEDKMSQPDFTIRIVKIERVQNTWLWELYQLSKKRMSEKNDGDVNEKALFHGTRQTLPKDIYESEQGFDNRLASQGLWGEGTYFAATAKYSHTYAHPLNNGHKQMFLAQVITGTSCKFGSQDSSLKAPPKKEDRRSFLSSLIWTHTSKFEGERYDSVTATANGSKIYVIYELGRVYPAYLITYTEL